VLFIDFVEGRFRRDKDFATQTINQFLDLMVHYQPSDKDRADQDPVNFQSLFLIGLNL